MRPVIFFCPRVTRINGGIRNIFRLGEVLQSLGHPVTVFEQDAQRPNWFENSLPVVNTLTQDLVDQAVVILPEDLPHVLYELITRFSGPKILYNQNHFYSAHGLGDRGSFEDFGIHIMLCSSLTILDHARQRFPNMRSSLLPCVVDTDLFKPSEKKRQIAYMPRKRMIESKYLKDMAQFTMPELSDWEWKAIDAAHERDVATAMSEAAIFLSLSRLEGFGLTPLEAMASGCVVAGFTGIGGREYATPNNGFWAAEDDFPACLDALRQAVSLSMDKSGKRQDYDQVCRRTYALYTYDAFRVAAISAWQEILGNIGT